MKSYISSIFPATEKEVPTLNDDLNLIEFTEASENIPKMGLNPLIFMKDESDAIGSTLFGEDLTILDDKMFHIKEITININSGLSLTRMGTLIISGSPFLPLEIIFSPLASGNIEPKNDQFCVDDASAKIYHNDDKIEDSCNQNRSLKNLEPYESGNLSCKYNY